MRPTPRTRTPPRCPHGRRGDFLTTCGPTRLLEHPTIAAAAENGGLSERSLYRYLEDEDFSAEYRCLRARLVEEVVAELQKIGVEAVGVLRASFEDESASVRLRAARTVLDLMFKGTEFSDWEDRLRQLEEAADKTEHW